MLNNQDFTQERAKHLGGSDLGAILGLSKYRTALDVWLEKTGKSTWNESTMPLRFGSFAESFVASEYSRETGFALLEYAPIILHKKHSFLGGHIDRFAVAGNILTKNDLFTEDGQCLATHILECKTANPFTQSEWGEPGTDQVPMAYLVQCLWYLLITQLERADLAVLFGNSDLRIYTINRDSSIEAVLLEKAVQFWEGYVKTDLPPPAQNEIDYKKLFAKSVQSKAVEAQPSTVELLATLPAVQAELDQCEERISNIKKVVMSEMQDAEILSFCGQTIATWKMPRISYRVDAKKLEQEHPELIAKYQTPIGNSRRLVIKSNLPPVGTIKTVQMQEGAL
jgi:putative phage-type endonuclease